MKFRWRIFSSKSLPTRGRTEPGPVSTEPVHGIRRGLHQRISAAGRRGSARVVQPLLRSVSIQPSSAGRLARGRTAGRATAFGDGGRAKQRHRTNCLRLSGTCEGSAGTRFDALASAIAPTRSSNSRSKRLAAGFELPIESTKAQLIAARVEQRLAHLEDDEDTAADQLRAQLGLDPDQPIEVVVEDIPAAADESINELVAQALQNNSEIKQAESQKVASEAHLKGERGGYWPTVSIIGQYNLLGKFNNYDQFFNKFERNNFIAGVQVQIPIFASRTTAAVAFARANLTASQMAVENKRTQVSLDVRHKARQAREMDQGREVARLELELAQQNLQILHGSILSRVAPASRTLRVRNSTKTTNGWRSWMRISRASRRNSISWSPQDKWPNYCNKYVIVFCRLAAAFSGRNEGATPSKIWGVRTAHFRVREIQT